MQKILPPECDDQRCRSQAVKTIGEQKGQQTAGQLLDSAPHVAQFPWGHMLTYAIAITADAMHIPALLPT